MVNREWIFFVLFKTETTRILNKSSDPCTVPVSQ